VFTHDYRELRLYHLDDPHCAKLVATIDTGGPFAFASIEDAQPGAMPELTVDTWLMHGDRRRTHFVWLKDGYIDAGPAEDVPGPRKRP
jgi:hypothetical protein